MMLRLHDPAGPGAESPHLWGFDRPVPVHYRIIEQATPHGPMVDHVLVWHAEDGRACSRCPLARCTFSAGWGDIGSCVVRRTPDDPPFDLMAWT